MFSKETYRKDFGKAKVIAVLMVILLPLVLIVIAHLMDLPEEVKAEGALVFYILLIFSAIGPAVYQIVKKIQIRDYRRGKMTAMTPGQFYVTSSTIKNAFVTTSFVYGLVVYMITHDIFKLYLFYVIGIIWAVIYFPSWERMEKFLKEVEGK